MTNNTWPFLVVSEGTHDPADLAVVFRRHYLELNTFFETKGLHDGSVWLAELDADTQELVDYMGTLSPETIDSYISDIFDGFDALCPEEYYFGAHPDDGACFGYWRFDED